MKTLKTSTVKRAVAKLREVEAALEDAVLAAARNRDLEVEGKKAGGAGADDRAYKAVRK